MKEEKSTSHPKDHVTENKGTVSDKESNGHASTTATSEKETSATNQAAQYQKHLDANHSEPQSETPQLNATSRSGISGATLATIAVAALAVLGGGYFLNKQQLTQYETQLNTLKSQLQTTSQSQAAVDLTQLTSTLSPQFTALESRLRTEIDNVKQQNSQLQQQPTMLEEMNQRINQQQTTLTRLNSQVEQLTRTETPYWELVQIDYFVKLANRALLVDQDIPTALYFLNTVESSLSQLNDPRFASSLNSVRADIKRLSAIKPTDFDQLILQLTQLTGNVDELPFVTLLKDDSEEKQDVSNSVNDWKQNLKKNWQSISSQFVTVKKRDKTTLTQCLAESQSDEQKQQCYALLALNASEQQHYLRENIKLQLLVATQSITRHQQESYQQSLTNVQNWLNAYFDINKPQTQAFLTTLKTLQAESINYNKLLGELQIFSTSEKKLLKQATGTSTQAQTQVPAASLQSNTTEEKPTSGLNQTTTANKEVAENNSQPEQTQKQETPAPVNSGQQIENNVPTAPNNATPSEPALQPAPTTNNNAAETDATPTTEKDSITIEQAALNSYPNNTASADANAENKG